MRKELVFEDIRLFLCKHADHDVDYNTLIVTIFSFVFKGYFTKKEICLSATLNIRLYRSTDVTIVWYKKCKSVDRNPRNDKQIGIITATK